MITFHQSTGIIEKDGVVIGKGYAGNGRGKNNPSMQSVHGVGPIPVGFYTIGPAMDHPESVGKFAMHLEPDPGNGMYGRSGFYFHGPVSMDDPRFGEESHGCPVAMRPVRVMVDADPDRRLEVVAQ